MQKLLTRKFLLPALTAALLVTGATAFLQSGFGRVIINCYTPFTTSPIDGGVQIDCPEGELVIAQVTVTPTQPGATLTPPVSTATSTPRGTGTKAATPTRTNTPTFTSTPVVTLTPAPLATLTEIPPVLFCLPPENAWHPPLDEPCKRYIAGHDPFDPEIVALFDTYGTPGEYVRWLNDYGVMWQIWVSSQGEITNHYRGFVWLFTENLQCDQAASETGGGGDVSNKVCIVWSMDRVHGDGLAEHSLNSRHSLTTHRIVCLKDAITGLPIISVATCGVFRGGMSQAESDQLQSPYKSFWCDTPTDNPLWTILNLPDVLNGGTYHSHPIQDSLDGREGLLLSGWWFQKPTPVEKQFYQYNPNNMFGTTYLEQVWQKFQIYLCAWDAGDAAEAGYQLSDNFTLLDAMKTEARGWPASPDGGHNFWMVLNLKIQAFNVVPQSGWTDQYGNIWPANEPDGGCQEPSFFCIPYSVEGNYPIGKEALLQRRFPGAKPELCLTAPCLTFETNNVPIVFPYLDMPTP